MTILTRRNALLGLAAAGVQTVDAGAATPATITQPFANGQRPLLRYPQKRPLIAMTTRPPQLETPFPVYDEGLLTRNDAFFVRYHLAGAPALPDLATYRLQVGGLVDRPRGFSLAELKAMPQTEVIAVNQCSGNGRGFSDPRVAGGQAGNGLMGNARWRGVALKHVLERVGVRAGAVQVEFDGLDGPVLPTTPDFVKALDLAHALDGEVMLAWAMNGEDLPILNGWPLRLVVPGYYGTYWVKHLGQITVLDKPSTSYWMTTAYRVPDNDCMCVPAGGKPDRTRPIGRLNVRSFLTNVASGDRLRPGRHTLRGIAFDGGHGIERVEVSVDGGRAWAPARLSPELGRYSFRGWTFAAVLPRGPQTLMARATSRDGGMQPMTQPWNPSGYMRNVVERVEVEVA